LIDSLVLLLRRLQRRRKNATIIATATSPTRVATTAAATIEGLEVVGVPEAEDETVAEAFVADAVVLAAARNALLVLEGVVGLVEITAAKVEELVNVAEGAVETVGDGIEITELITEGSPPRMSVAVASVALAVVALIVGAVAAGVVVVGSFPLKILEKGLVNCRR